jgi:hypothetical protein
MSYVVGHLAPGHTCVPQLHALVLVLAVLVRLLGAPPTGYIPFPTSHSLPPLLHHYNPQGPAACLEQL